MKRILIFCSLFTLGFATFAQDWHYEEKNKNITPYHDSKDALNGRSLKHLYTQTSWTDFQQKYPNWGVRMNRYTGMPHRAVGAAIPFAQGGNDPIAKAKAFLQQELNGFQIPINELIVTRNYNDGKYIHVDFKQRHQNMDVLWSRVTVRFTQDLRIVLFGIDAHKNIPNTTVAINPAQAKSIAENAVVTQVLNTEIKSELKWFPIPGENEYIYHPVYEINVHTQDDDVTPGNYLTYVDAIDGTVLYRQNKVVHIGFNVNADAYETNLYGNVSALPLKNLLININGTNYYTDLLGNVVEPSAGPINATVTLSGKYIKIVTGQSGTTSPTFSLTGVTNNASQTLTPNTTTATIRHFTCYYHANEIHDFMKTKFPSLTAMDNPLTARVDRTDGNCNAFYNGTSINFYTTSNGCNAFSQISDVMYHEYGHGINYEFYNDQGGSFDNGAMGEGYSDVWAMSIIKNGIIGPGYQIGAANSYIRRYDGSPKVYPQHLVGEVHADGEIIAGAWWDYAVNLSATMPLDQAVDQMSDLFTESQYGLATGPDGNEGQVYFDILIDALTYDDTDNNINNGTPNIIAITKAFARHGITILNNTEVLHEPTAQVGKGITHSVVANVIADFPAFVGDLKMFYRKKGTTILDSLPLTPTGSTYTGNFATPSTAQVYEYYFAIYDNINNNQNSTSPYNALFSTYLYNRNIPYHLVVGYDVVYTENFENTLNANWTIGNASNDNATAGKWIVDIPLASKTTQGDTVQTGKDHTTGSGKCAVTANASSVNSSVGSADVDNGRTTLITEEFDLSTYNNAILSYWRWYSNAQGSNPAKDYWRVYITYNNGTSWTQQIKTSQAEVGWHRNIIMPDYTKGNKVRLMFVATDSSQGSGGALVEAAIDDIQILEISKSGVGVQDINALSFILYPNPAHHEVSIQTNHIGNTKVQFLDLLGNIVFQKNISGNTATKVDVSRLTKGIYFVKLECDGKTSIQKMTIE
ncbi:MAG: T9SS type A sorting domain-containing protein [Chitinophagaceae bacterium]